MSGIRSPMMEHECAGCDGMLDAFIAGILHAYDEEPLEREFLKEVEGRLRDLLIASFGFCPAHADQAVARLRDHAAQAKNVNALGTKGTPS